MSRRKKIKSLLQCLGERQQTLGLNKRYKDLRVPIIYMSTSMGIDELTLGQNIDQKENIIKRETLGKTNNHSTEEEFPNSWRTSGVPKPQRRLQVSQSPEYPVSTSPFIYKPRKQHLTSGDLFLAAM